MQTIKLRNKTLQVPIIQGGMGVGVSLGNLAGHVAKCGGMGVISTAHTGYRCDDFWQNFLEDNLTEIKNEIHKAKVLKSETSGINDPHSLGDFSVWNGEKSAPLSQVTQQVTSTWEYPQIKTYNRQLSIAAMCGVKNGYTMSEVHGGEIADPEECAKITALGIDFLAAGIGNIHGVYPANWKGLDFEALDRIHKATNNIPLVLHGGTGIPDEMIAKAISLGVSKININTECQLVFAEATRKYIEEGKDQQGKGFDPRKLLAPGAKAIEAKCKEKIELFGCAGKG